MGGGGRPGCPEPPWHSVVILNDNFQEICRSHCGPHCAFRGSQCLRVLCLGSVPGCRRLPRAASASADSWASALWTQPRSVAFISWFSESSPGHVLSISLSVLDINCAYVLQNVNFFPKILLSINFMVSIPKSLKKFDIVYLRFH